MKKYKITSDRWSPDPVVSTIREIKQQAADFSRDKILRDEEPVSFRREQRNGKWVLVDNVGDVFAEEVLPAAKNYYAEHNGYGVNLDYASIGWKVFRFSSKAARDTFVDENKWNGCNQVNATISAKNISKIIGRASNGKTLVVVESWTDRATGVEVEEIQMVRWMVC